MQFNRTIISLVAALGITVLSGCAATQTMIAKGELETQTKMTDTVFLDPVGPDKKTVFLQFRNTSDKQNLTIENRIRQHLKSDGYTVVNNPDDAHYMIQTNILRASEMSPSAAKQAYANGFGGAVIGAGAGAAATGSAQGAAVGGLFGAITETVANAAVEDVTYGLVTDLQISERLYGGEATERTRSELKQGNSGGTTSTYTESSNWKRYQTRIVSVANKANLKFAEAQPELEDGLVKSISGIL